MEKEKRFVHVIWTKSGNSINPIVAIENDELAKERFFQLAEEHYNEQVIVNKVELEEDKT